jgi:hypothetical protein
MDEYEGIKQVCVHLLQYVANKLTEENLRFLLQRNIQTSTKVTFYSMCFKFQFNCSIVE